MAKTEFTSVDDYIAAQPEAVQKALERVRTAIIKALPGAEEVISYNIPTYKLEGVAVIYFAAWKRYFSLYPAGKILVTAFEDDLAPYEIIKSTIHFPFSRRVPVTLIGRIAKFRAKEVTDKAMTAGSKKR